MLRVRLHTSDVTSDGLESGLVRLVPYDPAWAELFTAEAERIHVALGPSLPLALEHTGGTAVPGLVAKPVLDLLGGYPPGARVEPYIAALVQTGYVHRGEQGAPVGSQLLSCLAGPRLHAERQVDAQAASAPLNPRGAGSV